MITADADDPDKLLVQAIGVRSLAAGIFNYTVGSGIFALPAIAAMQLGPASPLGYLIGAVIMGLMALCFAEAGSRVSVSGGPYAYVTTAMGPFVGFVGGVLLAAAVLAAAAAVATVFAASATRLLGAETSGLQPLLIVAVLVGASWLNVRGVDTGARLVEVMSAAKLVPLTAFVIVGAMFVRPENLVIADAPAPSQLLATTGILIFAFLGIEGALQPSAEVRTPATTVPRAAFLAIGGVTLLYLGVQSVAQGILGARLATAGVTPLADAAAVVAGTPGRLLMLVGATISMLGYLCGAALATPRLLFAFARDGFLPRALAAVHPVHRTPHRTIVLYTAIVVGLALSGTFERLLIIGNIAGLLLYALCAVAALILRRRGVRGEGEPFRTPGGALVPVLACAAIAWVLIETVARADVIAAAVLFALTCIAYAGRRVTTH
jgi:amino acid transporter